ncbi:MAG TPA: hypothetical protein VK487_06805 [Candidatus Bathyarchaeia archaeon]|nr:hypothetical protein [Candidatus Bathyarchaeia archaeon]
MSEAIFVTDTCLQIAISRRLCRVDARDAIGSSMIANASLSMGQNSSSSNAIKEHKVGRKIMRS